MYPLSVFLHKEMSGLTESAKRGMKRSTTEKSFAHLASRARNSITLIMFPTRFVKNEKKTFSGKMKYHKTLELIQPMSFFSFPLEPARLLLVLSLGNFANLGYMLPLYELSTPYHAAPLSVTREYHHAQR